MRPQEPSDYLADHLKPMLERYPNALGNVVCFAECGPGWMSLVEPVIAMCEHRGFRVAQIKEKFGGLRIHVDQPEDCPETSRQEVYAAIDAAQALSWRTCEECGEAGAKRVGGWIKVLCDPCQDTRNERRAKAWL